MRRPGGLGRRDRTPVVVCLWLAGCGLLHGPAGPPRIVDMVPDSASATTGAVVEVVLHGRGFAARGNTIRFGPVTLEEVPSRRGGTELRFTLPRELPARGEAPPALLLPGEYRVSVVTARGASNAVRFVLQ